MNKDELGKLYPVYLIKYDENWPLLYIKEKQNLLNIFNINLRIEHIGSTAVKGLSAKPTIDILLEKPLYLGNDEIIDKMVENGYIYMTEQLKHLMFVKGYGVNGLEKESFHVHMGPLDLPWLWDRVYFRDYLVKNRGEAIIYENMKKNLASKFQNDREAYTDGKTDYIKSITAKAKEIYLNNK